MTRKKPAKATEPATVVANDPGDRKGASKIIGGSECNDWNNTLANQTMRALWITSHAKQLAYAPEPTLPCPDPEREAVPVACGEG